MLKNNIIVFPTKLDQILPSLLVWPVFKTHSIFASISEYKKCGLYASIYSSCSSGLHLIISVCIVSSVWYQFDYVTMFQIFSSAVFNLEGQTKATRSKAVKNVRRHACCILIKICKQYPDLLLVSRCRGCCFVPSRAMSSIHFEVCLLITT